MEHSTGRNCQQSDLFKQHITKHLRTKHLIKQQDMTRIIAHSHPSRFAKYFIKVKVNVSIIFYYLYLSIYHHPSLPQTSCSRCRSSPRRSPTPPSPCCGVRPPARISPFTSCDRLPDRPPPFLSPGAGSL